MEQTDMKTTGLHFLLESRARKVMKKEEIGREFLLRNVGKTKKKKK